MKTNETKLKTSKKIKSKSKSKKIESENAKKEEHISLFNAIKTNILPILAFGFASVILSIENLLLGIFLAILGLFAIYFGHVSYHSKLNPLYYLHKYHHENSGLFSQFIEVLIDAFLFIFPLVLLPDHFNNEWLILFFAFIYTSIHIVNYGVFHVNDVHALHHKDIDTNFSPDFCDILFGTKHESETQVENINHYIPNIIIIFTIIYLFKELCKYKPGFYDGYRCVLSWYFRSNIAFFALATFYLLFTNKVSA